MGNDWEIIALFSPTGIITCRNNFSLEMQESSCGEGLFKDDADPAGNKAERWERGGRGHTFRERERERERLRPLCKQLDLTQPATILFNSMSQ